MGEENRIERHRLSTGSYGPAERALGLRHPVPPGPFESVEIKDPPELLTFWRLLQKRRWTILLTLLVLFTGVLVGTLLQTPVYRAKALIEFEKEARGIPTLQEMFELEGVSNSYLQTQYKILQSASLAQRVIDELRLETHEAFNDAQPTPGSETKVPAQETTAQESLAQRAPKVYEKVLKAFQARLGIAPVLNSRLVTVSFESQDPQLAADVVNSLIANYGLQAMEANQQAKGWLSQELRKTKERLEKSEVKLNEYARSKNLLFLEREEGAPENIANQRLRRLQEELTRAQAARFEKEALSSLVGRGDFASLPGSADNRLMQDLSLRLADLKRQEAQLAATFSREYPKVKEIRNQIDELERALRQERQRAAKRITNQHRAAMRREELARRAFYGQKENVSQMAEGVVQYNILQREVKTQKQLYETLLQRDREAGVSAGLKASSVHAIDSARPPVTPAKPILMLNLALAIIVGLGSGLGLGCLQEYLDSSLKSPVDVERSFQIPALGLIPTAEPLDDAGNRRHRIYDHAKHLAGRAWFFADRSRLLANGK